MLLSAYHSYDFIVEREHINKVDIKSIHICMLNDGATNEHALYICCCSVLAISVQEVQLDQYYYMHIAIYTVVFVLLMLCA